MAGRVPPTPKPIVARAVQALHDGLIARSWTGLFVSRQRPSTRTGFTTLPHSWIRVTRSGGGTENVVTDKPQLLVECWNDEGRIEELSNEAVAVLAAIAGERNEVAFVREVDITNGPVEMPDPLVTSHDRMQFTAELNVRN